MALEKTELGNTAVNDRLCHFKNGNPVNMPQWEFFKKIPHLLIKPYAVSEDLINETWNPILDSMSGMVLNTSIDRFKVWCAERDFVYHHDIINRRFEFISKPLIS